MSELRTSLESRKEEFETHLTLAVALEDRIFAGDDVSIGSTKLSARHLLTMKSGLIVHLYNIVEATMSGTINLVGAAVGGVPSRQWSEKALREWLREHAVARLDGDEDARLATMHSVSLRILSETPVGTDKLKKPSGTWDDKRIAMFAKRLGVDLTMPEAAWRRIAPRPEFNDKSPLGFLAERRNALAHGRRSFETGANDLTLAKIREIADVTLEFLDLTVQRFQNYVDQNAFVAVSA